jgi:hypothetical protein
MKNALLFNAILGFAAVTALPGLLSAQTPSKKESPSASTSAKNVLNRELPGWLRINGSIRGRWEDGFTTATGVGTLFSGEYLHQAGQHSNYTYPFFAWTRRF